MTDLHSAAESATALLVRAETLASERIAEGEARKEELIAEGEAHARITREDAERETAELTANLEVLRTLEATYRTRLREYLEAALERLNSEVPGR
jgi:hypothetical protein